MARIIDGAVIDYYDIDGGASPSQFNPSNSNPASNGTSTIPGVNFTFSDFLFTMTIDSNGSPTVEYDFDAIKQSIQTILSTSPGERMMLPTFGCNVPSYVFEPCNALTARNLSADIKDALIEWENRISVNSVDVTPSPDQNAFYIDINYTLIFGGAVQTYSAQLQTQPL